MKKPELAKRLMLIDDFQKLLDTHPNPKILAASCANIAEQYVMKLSQSKEECANYARSKAVTDGEIKQKIWNHIADKDEYADVIIDGKIDDATTLIADFIIKEGAKWMREQQGEGAKELELFAEYINVIIKQDGPMTYPTIQNAVKAWIETSERFNI